MARRSKSVVIERISVPKPQEVLAEQLREAILRGDIVEGEALPAERDIVAQTGLSRGSVREALRTLAFEGLVRTRPGRFGGNIATIPGKETLTASISRFVTGRRMPLRLLQEAREVLEPALAKLAALHRTEQDLVTLRLAHEDLVQAMDNFQKFSLTNVKWHNLVAQASGNELLAAMLYSISYGIAVSTTSEEYDTPETRREVILIHERITQAIEARDGEVAERLMRRHIGATHERAAASDTTSIPLSEEQLEKPKSAKSGRKSSAL